MLYAEHLTAPACVEAVKNNIILGDTVQALGKLPDGCADLIFADPPYFMQTQGELLRSDGSKFAGVEDSWDKFSGYQEYDHFCRLWLEQCRRVLKPDGAIWVIGAFQNIYRLGYLMQELGFWILNDVVWSKPNAAPNFGGTRFQNAHETLLWCARDRQSRYTFNYKTMKYLNAGKQDKSVWDISICIGGERLKGPDGKKAHSTLKPEKLLEKVILSSSRPGDLVLDPFFGTGTTGAVAKRYGRNFLGIEREAEYVRLAERRLAGVTDQSDRISNLALEVKPPRVPMARLIREGYLTPGQPLYDATGAAVCTVLADGQVTDGQDTLSIHRMSAKRLGQVNHNGWDFFFVRREGRLVALDRLRYLCAGAEGA